MSESLRTPAELDDYIAGIFAPEDAALLEAVAEMEHAGLPTVWRGRAVSASQGKLLMVLCHAVGARRVLEIGTLCGYSTIWLARAVPAAPEGRVVTLELDPQHAAIARRNIARAGLEAVVDLRVGPAAGAIRAMAAANEAPFDVVFIDADKDGYVAYLDLCLALVRVGGLVLGDNALSHGALDPGGEAGVTRYAKAVAARPGLSSTIVPTLREAIDGMVVTVKRSA
jgi:predicted O-methyltransferase YrrM